MTRSRRIVSALIFLGVAAATLPSCKASDPYVYTYYQDGSGTYRCGSVTGIVGEQVDQDSNGNVLMMSTAEARRDLYCPTVQSSLAPYAQMRTYAQLLRRVSGGVQFCGESPLENTYSAGSLTSAAGEFCGAGNYYTAGQELIRRSGGSFEAGTVYSPDAYNS